MQVQGGHFSREFHVNSMKQKKWKNDLNQTTRKTRQLESKIRKQHAKNASAHSFKMTKEMYERQNSQIGPIDVAINLQVAYLILRKKH